MTQTTVVLLGTGTPNADPERMGPSTAIVVDNRAYIIDCGPGLVRRAQQAVDAGVAGLNLKGLDRLFLTHLHSDHTVGLPDLIFSPWVLGRETPLEVYGPGGTCHLVDHVVKAYGEDIQARTCGLEPINMTGGSASGHEPGTGICYQDELVTVEAFPVDHGSTWQAYGYRFVTPDRVIVVSGDTAPRAENFDLWQGCDVLVHEVYSQAGFAKRSPDWQNYHSHMHTSGPQLGKIAARVAPKKLVLTHLLLWGATEAELLAEIQEHFDGEICCGTDLGVY